MAPARVSCLHTGSGKNVLSLEGHTAPVITVAFSPDGL
jgi:hypothetical protein